MPWLGRLGTCVLANVLMVTNSVPCTGRIIPVSPGFLLNRGEGQKGYF